MALAGVSTKVIRFAAATCADCSLYFTAGSLDFFFAASSRSMFGARIIYAISGVVKYKVGGDLDLLQIRKFRNFYSGQEARPTKKPDAGSSAGL